MTAHINSCLSRLKWSYSRNPIFYDFFVAVFILKFNGLVQCIFFRMIYQVTYPVISNTSNSIPYNWDEKFWKKLPVVDKVDMKKMELYGDLNEFTLDIYKKDPITYTSLLNYYVCSTDSIKPFMVGNSQFPNHHQWFENFDPQLRLTDNYTISNIAITLPYSPKVSIPFYTINIFSFLFSANDSFSHKIPIVFGQKFDHFDEITDLAGLSGFDLQYPNITLGNKYDDIIFINNAFFFNMPDPYTVAYGPIQKMVKIMKSRIQHNASENKPIIISIDGDLRMLGKQKFYQQINETFKNQVVVLSFTENSSFIEYASHFIHAKVAISFVSETMSLIPFMEPGSVYIEIQDPSIISRNVLLAQAFGLKVYVIPASQYNVSNSILNNVTNIITKVLK